MSVEVRAVAPRRRLRRAFERVLAIFLPWEVCLRRELRFTDLPIYDDDPRHDERDLEEEEYFDRERIWETGKWCLRAYKYHARLPPYPPVNEENEFWERPYYHRSRLVLTEAGKAEIHRQIREDRTVWFRVVTALVLAVTGLLGTLIGLLSFLKAR